MKLFIFFMFFFIACNFFYSKVFGYKNAEYYKQAKILQKCTSKFSNYDKSISNFYANVWLNEVANKIVNNLSQIEKSRFYSRRYKDCYKKLSRHVSEMYLCEFLYDIDYIYGYETFNIQKCIYEINDKHMVHLDLYVPKIDIGDLAEKYGVFVSRRDNINILGRINNLSVRNINYG